MVEWAMAWSRENKRDRSRSPNRVADGPAPGPAEVIQIQSLVNQRQFCRRCRDFPRADEIQEQLRLLHVEIDDMRLTWVGPGGIGGAVENGGQPARTSANGNISGEHERRTGDWDCPACGKVVFASKEECFSCGTSKSGIEKLNTTTEKGLARCVYAIKECWTKDKFDPLVAQLRNKMGELPGTLLAAVTCTAARVVQFDPENLVQLVPTVAKKLQLQVNGVAKDPFRLDEMVDILASMAKLQTFEFVVFDSVATILMDETDAIDSKNLQRLVEVYTSTGDQRHEDFLKTLKQKQIKQEEERQKQMEAAAAAQRKAAEEAAQSPADTRDQLLAALARIKAKNKQFGRASESTGTTSLMKMTGNSPLPVGHQPWQPKQRGGW